MNIKRRLNVLEQQSHKPNVLGFRTFQQSQDTSEIFYELSGAFYEGPQGYTRADLDSLSEIGWQLIIVVYGSAAG